MATVTSGFTAIDFDQPDEIREFPNGRWDIVHVGASTMARATMQPGWHWAEHVKPIAGTEYCQQRHIGVVVSGRLRVRMQDGAEMTCTAGQVYVIEPGHDGWAEGDAPTVVLEFATRSAETYATRA